MKLKEKTPHTILNEIIEAAKECGQVMLQADRENFGIKEKQILLRSMIAKFRKC